MFALNRSTMGASAGATRRSAEEVAPRMALSDTSVRNAKPKQSPYKLADGKGLFLLVQPSGSRLWRMKYRVNGRDDAGLPKRVEKKLSLGTYPEIGLKEARELRDAARSQLANGIDPAVEKKRQRALQKVAAVNTFAATAKAFIEKSRRDGLSDATVLKREWLLRILEKPLGKRPISEVTPIEILAAVRPYEQANKHETACRALQFIGQIFRYAVANQLAPSDPTRDLRGALIRPTAKPRAAIVDEQGVSELLRAIDGYSGHPLTQIALRLSPLVFVRPGELRQAEWTEVDLEKAVWRIPLGRMKSRREHVVPLSRQAVELFRKAQQFTAGERYVFRGLRTRTRPMSENTIAAALRRLGYSGEEMSAHGFRAMASSLLNESGRWSPDAVERALAHKDRDRVRGLYHRGAHWNERVQMAQWWADYLDQLRERPTKARLMVAA